jgi:hypothetical protein
VRSFLVHAYAQGALVTPEVADFEGSTSVFTKRRYRDKWNQPIVKRLAKSYAHSLKIRGRCRAFYAKGNQWLSERRTNALRQQTRTQSMWVLHLAGHWLRDSEGSSQGKHSMRVMLIANVDVKQRFANGTQGRLLWWHPGSVERRKALPSSHPELLARFAKESAFANKGELLQEVDFMDVTARPEGLKGCSGAAMIQLPLQPAYGLTVHKVQALTIAHIVRGCLEGVFAAGSLYVLISRVTDPRNLQLIGVPPADLLDDVAEELQRRGVDVNAFFRAACAITKEWVYTGAPNGHAPGAARDVRNRLRPRLEARRRIPLKLRNLQETLEPQPAMTAVISRFLEWAEREDAALHAGLPPPKFETPNGADIFPSDGEEWWLTDVQLRKEKATEKLIEDGPASGDENQEQEPLVLPDDDSSDGIGGDASDGSGGAPNEGEAMDWGTEDWTAEPTSEGGMPASRQHPLGLWR